MSTLCFILSYPTHVHWKHEGVETWQLVFRDAKIAPGVGKLPVSYEIFNHEYGEKGASYWDTIDVSSDDAQNIVRFTTGGNAPDQIVVERPPRLHVNISLSPDSFSRLLQINWKEHFINLTVRTKIDQSIHGLKLPFDRKTMQGEDVTMPIGWYCIEWEERPVSPRKDGHEITLFHAMKRLFRFFFGH
jgi:hypothetical protein